MQEDAEKDQTETEPVEISVNRRDPQNPRVATDPNTRYIRPGDRVKWTCKDGPFAIQFEPLSPLTLRRLRSRMSEDGDHIITGEVHRQNRPGTYRYFVAVAMEDGIFTEDPELIDDPDDPVFNPPLPQG